jgi:hypothetical protein
MNKLILAALLFAPSLSLAQSTTYFMGTDSAKSATSASKNRESIIASIVTSANNDNIRIYIIGPDPKNPKKLYYFLTTHQMRPDGTWVFVNPAASSYPEKVKFLNGALTSIDCVVKQKSGTKYMGALEIASGTLKIETSTTDARIKALDTYSFNGKQITPAQYTEATKSRALLPLVNTKSGEPILDAGKTSPAAKK